VAGNLIGPWLHHKAAGAKIILEDGARRTKIIPTADREGRAGAARAHLRAERILRRLL